MTKIKQRNKNGYYNINNTDYISVTTLINKILGTPESMVQHYHCKVFWQPFVKMLSSIFLQGGSIINILSLMKNPVYQMAIDDRDEKGRYGTWAHDQLKKHYYDNQMVQPELANRVRQINEIYGKLMLQPVFGEKTLYSDKLQSAGTCDDIRESHKFKEKQFWFIDYKTGSANRKKELLQIGTYGYFAIEMGLCQGMTPDNINGLILHIGRKPDDHVSKTIFTPAQMKQGFTGFKYLLKYNNLINTKK